MPFVKCTNCGASLKTANPVAAGKKLKCPKCAKIFVVEDEEEKADAAPEEEETGAEDEGSEEEDTPKPKKPVKAARDEDDEESEGEEEETPKSKKPAKSAKGAEDEPEDEEDEDETPKKKGKPDAKGKKDGAPKKGAGMLIGLIAVVLVLCCGGAGTASWLMQATIKGWFGGKIDEVAKNAGNDKTKEDKTKSESKDKDKGKDKTPNLNPEFIGTVEEFSEEFNKDPKAADKKYLAKFVELSATAGAVLSHDDVFSNKRKLNLLFGGSAISGKKSTYRFQVEVQPADWPIAYRLSSGQKIKIVARLSSHVRDAGYIGFDSGKLIEVDKSTIRELTSEGLAANFAKENPKYNQKYSELPLLVTGVVQALKSDSNTLHYVTLKGTEKLPVVALVEGRLDSALKDHLKIGETIVLRVGDCSYVNMPKGNGAYLSSVVVTDLAPSKTIEPPKDKIDTAKTLPISADELAGAVDAAPNGFREKYRGKDVVVKGIVDKTEMLDNVSLAVWFKTDTKTKIRASFAKGEFTATKGQTVEFRPDFSVSVIDGGELRIFAKLVK